MRRVLLTGILLLAASGCRDIIGPFEARKPERVDDPRYTIPEQESRGRDRLALPTDSGPPTGMEPPDTYGHGNFGPNYNR